MAAEQSMSQPSTEYGKSKSSHRLLTRLARLYRLDVWGERFERATKELEMAALLLTVILLFDILAWTIVFTFVFREPIAYSGG